MRPVVTPEEMAAVDRAAPVPVEILIDRAGTALAMEVRRFLGGSYGRRVSVVAGPGNNGADGRRAADWLRRWGARVTVVAPGQRVPAADVVIDAAFGTGLSREYRPPDVGGIPVVAADIPSGLSGITGRGDALQAAVTVTFGALKPGLLVGDGPERCGQVIVAGIGLEDLADERASAWLVEDDDINSLPVRKGSSHKWQTAVLVVGGSEAMNGAPLLVSRAAMRAGAGYALVGVPGAPEGGGLPPGAQVGVELPLEGWADEAARAAERVKAIVVGPGLGDHRAAVPDLVRRTSVPIVVDADGINSFDGVDALAAAVAAREAPVVITPHEGEFRRLSGHAPGDDRIADVRDIARRSGAIVLLKGSTTVVAAPDGRVLVSDSGSSRLATAGTGDVLSGVIGAFLARGLAATEAAALAAHVHGRAGQTGYSEGLLSTDLPDLVAGWLSGRVGGR